MPDTFSCIYNFLRNRRVLKINEHLRIETELREKKRISSQDWQRHSLNFLKTHKYFTTYCKQLLMKNNQKMLSYFNLSYEPF